MILIDQVQTHMDEGDNAWNVEAAVHRTRPVMLTALPTVLTMIPLARSVYYGAGFHHYRG